MRPRQIKANASQTRSVKFSTSCPRRRASTSCRKVRRGCPAPRRAKRRRSSNGYAPGMTKWVNQSRRCDAFLGQGHREAAVAVLAKHQRADHDEIDQVERDADREGGQVIAEMIVQHA